MQGRVVKGDPIQHGVVSRPGKGIIFGPADHSRQAGGNRLTADLGKDDLLLHHWVPRFPTRSGKAVGSEKKSGSRRKEPL